MNGEEIERKSFVNAIKLAKLTEELVSKKSLTFSLQGMGRVLFYALRRLSAENMLRTWGAVNDSDQGYLGPITGRLQLNAKLYQKQENEGLNDIYWELRGAIARRTEDGKEPYPYHLSIVLGALTRYVTHYTHMLRTVDMLLSISKHIADHGSSAEINYPSTRISPAAVASSMNPIAVASELERFYEGRSGQNFTYMVDVLDRMVEQDAENIRRTYSMVERYKRKAKAVRPVVKRRY